MTSFYNDAPEAEFPADLKDKIMFGGTTESDLELLTEPTGTNLAKLAASYSDGIIYGSDDLPAELKEFCEKTGLPVLPFDAEAVQNGTYIDNYNSFYDSL